VSDADVIANDIAATDPDARLMMRVRDDDEQAFTQIVERYQHRVMGILYHLVGNEQDAEDVAQDVFMTIYRVRKGYQPTAKFSTWLFTIVNNKALNAIRNQKRRAGKDLVGSESGPLGPRPLENVATAPSGAMPSRIFAKGELAAVVRDAIGNLNDDQRMAVMLNKYEDMSYKQIAEIMGRSEMAVKSLLSRARAVLRETLEPYLSTGAGATG
jgi:RNA polymerase sigma-70 factor, ECF subfamily